MTIKKKAASSSSKDLVSSKEIKTQQVGCGPDTAEPDRAQRNEPLSATKLQILTFENAVQNFAQRRFADAMRGFEEAIRGPAPHVSDKARSYHQVCSRKIAANDLHLQTAEDYFNYGVERLNARDVAQARTQFSRALAIEPDADYILYTLALACGLDGDGDAAYANLKRAIELEPKNRILARQDTEFSALAQQFPTLRTLFRSEQNSPF